MPQAWYNVRADMKNKPAPLLNPGTLQPMTFQELRRGVLRGAGASRSWTITPPTSPSPRRSGISIRCTAPPPWSGPTAWRKSSRPRPRFTTSLRATTPRGSHKLNSAIAQAYYAKKQGLKGVTTETGAGQWGTALSMACAYLGLDCQVYMVKVSYEQKPFRREVMRTYGASVTPSPSETTAVGRKILAEHPGTTGSLGCAISEAVEAATSQAGYRYVLGQRAQPGAAAPEPSSAWRPRRPWTSTASSAGHRHRLRRGRRPTWAVSSPPLWVRSSGASADYRIIAVEPASCPSLTRGKFAYDFCDTGMVCPLAKMYTLGSGFIPSANHAGGLRYHGMSPVVSQLYHDGLIEATQRGADQGL